MPLDHLTERELLVQIDTKLTNALEVQDEHGKRIGRLERYVYMGIGAIVLIEAVAHAVLR